MTKILVCVRTLQYIETVTHVVRGSYGGVEAEEWALLMGMEDIRDLGIGGGCTDSLLSSPFGTGVTKDNQSRKRVTRRRAPRSQIVAEHSRDEAEYTSWLQSNSKSTL